ncbi:hypothetical protein HAX54_013708, partial [Datura stramonium]|nr:hypothetical protein [Datura stramonium]
SLVKASNIGREISNSFLFNTRTTGASKTLLAPPPPAISRTDWSCQIPGDCFCFQTPARSDFSGDYFYFSDSDQIRFFRRLFLFSRFRQLFASNFLQIAKFPDSVTSTLCLSVHLFLVLNMWFQ